MLKNINISEYFEIYTHEKKLDDKLWNRDAILGNMEKGFENFKCTRSKTWDNRAVVITKL